MRYKLTTQDMRTQVGKDHETFWVVGKWERARGRKAKNLCSNSYIHWYSHPLLAVLLNSVHARILSPRLWEIETDGDERDMLGMKGGSKKVRLVREIAVPTFTKEQLACFAILCAKKVYHDRRWNKWANKWLNGTDRSNESARDIWGITAIMANSIERMGYHQRQKYAIRAAICASSIVEGVKIISHRTAECGHGGDAAQFAAEAAEWAVLGRHEAARYTGAVAIAKEYYPGDSSKIAEYADILLQPPDPTKSNANHERVSKYASMVGMDLVALAKKAIAMEEPNV